MLFNNFQTTKIQHFFSIKCNAAVSGLPALENALQFGWLCCQVRREEILGSSSFFMRSCLLLCFGFVLNVHEDESTNEVTFIFKINKLFYPPEHN